MTTGRQRASRHIPRGAAYPRPRSAAAAAALGAALIAAGCAVEKPQVPRSSIVLRVPVANDTTALSEIVAEEADYLGLRADGSIAFRYDREFSDLEGRSEVGGRLAVTPKPARFAAPLGEIAFAGREIVLPPITAGAFLPAELLGQEIRVPEETSLSGLELELPLPGVESLEVASGSLTVTIANGLPLAFVDLELALLDRGRTVQTAEVRRIDAGGTGAAVFDLTDRRISGDLVLLLESARLEAPEETVTLRAEDSLAVTFGLSRLGVREATAPIEPQVVAPDEPAVITLPADHLRLTRALIESGRLSLVVTNELPVAMDVTLALPEVAEEATGVSAAGVIDGLGAGASREVVIPLDGHVFRPDDPLEMRVGYTGRTHRSKAAVTLRPEAALIVEAVPEKLTFREVSGRFDRLQLPAIEPRTRYIDLPAGADTINAVAFDSAGMRVTYTSAVGVPGRLDLRVVGTDSAIPDSAGLERTLQLRLDTEAGSPADPVTRSIDVAPGRLTPFLDFLPTRVTVHTDSILIGAGFEGDTSRVAADHWIRLDKVAFEAPARLLADTSWFESSPRSQGAFTDAEARRRINANIEGAVVTTTVLNKTPLAIGVRLFTAYDPGLVFSDPILTLPKEDGQYFGVDPDAPGIRQVFLTADDLRLLLDIDPDDPGPADPDSRVRTLYSGVKVRLASPTWDQIHGDDIVVVQAQAEIFIELNESLVE